MAAINRRKSPTQLDVARVAGVSRTTVSYVLNHNTDIAIPNDTRQRVWEAIAELGYVPNRAARSLRTHRTYTIAGIIQDITNPFHPAFERGIQDVAERYGYDLIMYNTDGQRARELKALQSIQQGRADGVVGIFFHIRPDDLDPLVESGIPVVWLHGGRCETSATHAYDRLLVDNAGGARAAVAHLVERGHRHIALLAGEGPPSADRLQGYRQGLAAAGLPFDSALVLASRFTIEDGQRLTLSLLERSPRPTAIFASSDMLALGAYLAARDAGLRIPDDLAVVGFDDIVTARLVTPPLTTVRLPQRDLGQRAAEMLFERLEGRASGPGRCEEQPFEFVVRGSA
jgi:LacI family transcriptional regulator